MKRTIQTLFGIACCIFAVAGLAAYAPNPPETHEVIVEEIDSNQYQDYMAKHKLVVVDIYAPWCPPCHRLAPIVQEMAQKYGQPARGDKRVAFVKINLDNNRQLGSTLGIRSIPTIVFYLNGQEVGRVVGLLSASDLESKIQQYFLNP
jgi:thioredoxin 1